MGNNKREYFLFPTAFISKAVYYTEDSAFVPLVNTVSRIPLGVCQSMCGTVDSEIFTTLSYRAFNSVSVQFISSVSGHIRKILPQLSNYEYS